MSERAFPPPDIEPAEFFTRWVPRNVAEDEHRRQRLGHTEATLQFDLEGQGGGTFQLHLGDGAVRGEVGNSRPANLRIRLDLATWRQLNSGEMSAPEAFLRRRVHLKGNLALAVKLALILG